MGCGACYCLRISTFCWTSTVPAPLAGVFKSEDYWFKADKLDLSTSSTILIISYWTLTFRYSNNINYLSKFTFINTSEYLTWNIPNRKHRKKLTISGWIVCKMTMGKKGASVEMRTDRGEKKSWYIYTIPVNYYNSLNCILL